MKSKSVKTSADHTAKYAKKRTARKLNIDLYLDDPLEKKIYEKLKAGQRGNTKKTLIELLKKHYEI